MNCRTALRVVLLAAMLLPQASIADTAVQRALAFAERLQQEADVSAEVARERAVKTESKLRLAQPSDAVIPVAVARERVTAAEVSLRLAQSAEAYAKSAHDREAMPVAAEAVLEAGQGLREAQQLLMRAEALQKGGQDLREAQQLLARAENLQRNRATTVRELQVLKRDRWLYGVTVPIEGDVRRVNAPGNAYEGIYAYRGLNPGDRIETGPNGKARLFVASGDGEVELGKNSSFTVEYDGVDGLLGYLERGAFYARREYLRITNAINKKIEMRTPSAIVAVRGTIFGVEVLSDGTLTKTFEGSVAVTPTTGGDPVEVTAGTQRRFITGQGFLPAEPLAEADKKHPWSGDNVPR